MNSEISSSKSQMAGSASETEPTEGITRRSTTVALERLSHSTGKRSQFSSWYVPGTDYFLYSPAEAAHRKAEASLKRLKLTPEQIRSLSTSRSLEIITQRMQDVQKEHDSIVGEKSTAMKKLSRLINGFSQFALKISGIVEILLPQKPEYTVTYGLVMILFQAVADKAEKQESLANFVTCVADQLPMISFYESIFPTNEIKMTTTAIYVEIINFLENATRYYCAGSFTKLIDSFLKPIENDFDSYMEKIAKHAKKLKDLKEAAHVAQTNDMKDALDDNSIVLARLYKNFESAVSAIGSSVALLNQKVEILESNQSYITEFHAKSYAQSLCQDVYRHLPTADETIQSLSNRQFQLSPKDHWAHNGILTTFRQWSDAGRKEPLWVVGRSGNQENWVTKMSIDLVRALESQQQTVAFVFCGEGKRDITPLVLVQHLIMQLLQACPLLAFHNPNYLNSHRLKRAKTFTETWEVWKMLVGQAGDIYVVIDRVDQCAHGEEIDVTSFLQRLSDLVQSYPEVSVVLTSETASPPVVDNMKEVFIDTSISSHKRNERYR